MSATSNGGSRTPAAIAGRRFSMSSGSSSSSTLLPHHTIHQQTAQDLSVAQSTNGINGRRRKAPEDYVDQHEDLEVRDSRLVCKYCSVTIGASRHPSGSLTNGDDASGLSRSSRILEHLQSKRHIVQKQLYMMNTPVVASAVQPSASDTLSKPLLDLIPPGSFDGLLEGMAANLSKVGAVGHLTSALKSAANVIDTEIADIDDRIGHLQGQIDQLRAKRAKLAGHKSDISRSIVGVSSVETQQPLPASSSSSAMSSLLFPNDKNRHSTPSVAASLLPTFATPNFGPLRSSNEIFQDLTASISSNKLNSSTFNAMLASAAESASALMSVAAAAQQQQQQLQQTTAKPLHSVLSSVIDASQAEDFSSSEQPEPDSGHASGADDGLLCLSLAAAAATPQPTASSSSSGIATSLDSSSSSKGSENGSGSVGGSRRKTLKPTRLLARPLSSSAADETGGVSTLNHSHDQAQPLSFLSNSTSPNTVLSSNTYNPAGDDVDEIAGKDNMANCFDEDTPLSLVKYEQRDHSGVNLRHSSLSTGGDIGTVNKMTDADRPTTPEIQQYNPALADKRFRGKAVQYCLLRRFTDHEAYCNWIRLQKVTRDKRTDTETGVKDFFRCPYARKIGWQPCPFRMYALFRPDTPGQITVFRSEVDHYHAQLPADSAAAGGNSSNNTNSNNTNTCGAINIGSIAATNNSNVSSEDFELATSSNNFSTMNVSDESRD